MKHSPSNMLKDLLNESDGGSGLDDMKFGDDDDEIS